MSSESASKAANLARIRENQRRCRARRKEYITELEEKLRNYEQGRIQASVEIQTTAQKVERENRILRGLLRSVGFDDRFQDKYINSQTELPLGWRSEPPASLEEPLSLLPPEWPLPTILDQPSTDDVANTQMPDNISTDTFQFAGEIFPVQSTFDFNNDQKSLGQDLPQPHLLPEPHPCGAVPYAFPSCTDGMGSTNLDDGTTLCSQAYTLVTTNNKKGYDDLELNLRLCGGFRKGRTPLEGCRVENKVLFAVLAEIS